MNVTVHQTNNPIATTNLPALVTIISVPSSLNSSQRAFISRVADTLISLACRGFLGAPPPCCCSPVCPFSTRLRASSLWSLSGERGVEGRCLDDGRPQGSWLP